jgi:hypothetical protein
MYVFIVPAANPLSPAIRNKKEKEWMTGDGKQSELICLQVAVLCSAGVDRQSIP